MIKVKEIVNKYERTEIAGMILRALPDYFENDLELIHHITTVRDKKFYVATEDSKPVGFMSMSIENEYTARIHVLGILEDFLDRSAGSQLIGIAIKHLKKNNYRYLLVDVPSEQYMNDVRQQYQVLFDQEGFYKVENHQKYEEVGNRFITLAKKIH